MCDAANRDPPCPTQLSQHAEPNPYRTLRRSLALLLAVVLGAACSSDPTGAGGSGGGGPDPGPGSYSHTLAPGASANDLLSEADFTHLVVQIQYVEGFPPTSQGLQELAAFLDARLHKSGGITLLPSQAIQITPQATYSASDIRAIEAAHRTAYTRGDTLATYVLFLDGEFSGGSNVLGVAYNNTSTALFQEKIMDHTGGALEPPQSTVEATVLLHEFGHLMGLVNNGSPMQTEHQDEPHGHHCDDPDCLMYYAVRTTDFLSNLTGGDIPELDPDCLDDLAANGGR